MSRNVVCPLCGIDSVIEGRGRGDTFAKAAHGGMGTLDWADVETMIDEAIKQGISDPHKLAIAGQSQGGFLAAWACTQTDRFKAAVTSAGISDWGTLILQSDLPDMEVSPRFPRLTPFFSPYTLW